MFNFLRTIFSGDKKKEKDIDLDEIALRGISQVGFFSEESLHRAFLDAGLSEEQSRIEAKKRAWHID